jgi:hypothetical protein
LRALTLLRPVAHHQNQLSTNKSITLDNNDLCNKAVKHLISFPY